MGAVDTSMSSDGSKFTSSSIQVTSRSDRSFVMHVLHLICRSFRNHLGRPTKKQPKGSVRLSAAKAILKSCTVSERTVRDVYIYDILPRHRPRTAVTKRIYYFNGGGWQSPPSSQHWRLCAKLAQELPDTMVSIVSYPLAPNNPAPVAIPILMDLYRSILQAADDAGEKVILAGDSAGGNIILGITLEALLEDESAKGDGDQETKRPHPVALMAISPSTDLTRSNPDIEKISPFDPLLTPAFIKSTAKAWQSDWDPTDRRISPFNADISLLAKYGVKVHGITGGYDILRPDAIIFRDKCAREGVVGEWLDWDKQMHCFLLVFIYGVREGREAVDWMINVLKKE